LWYYLLSQVPPNPFLLYRQENVTRPCAELIFQISKMKGQKREKRNAPRNLPGKKIGPEECQGPEKRQPSQGCSRPHAAVSLIFFSIFRPGPVLKADDLFWLSYLDHFSSMHIYKYNVLFNSI
jgi:hypothetical protein